MKHCGPNCSMSLPLVVVVAILGGCSDSTEPPAGDRTPPDACLHMVISEVQNDWFTHRAAFVVSAACSTDDTSPRDSLKARWDFDGDGTWDTEFEPELIIGHEPDPPPSAPWHARCEIRDAAGNTDVVEDTVPLPDWLPVPPDIITGDLTIHQQGTLGGVDTLFVGQEFGVRPSILAWMGTPVPEVEVQYFIDGDLVKTTDRLPFHPFLDTWGIVYTVRYEFTIDTPGTHEITCIADADDAVAETDETNNRAVRTIEVVEAP